MSFQHARVASRLGSLTHHAAVRAPRLKPPSALIWRLIQFGLLALPFHASGQISLITVTQCGPASLPGSACTIPRTAAGHLLVVGLQAGSGINTATTIASITDNVGNVYVEANTARSIDAAAGALVDFWYAKNSAAGGTTITVTPSASLANVGVIIWEFAGADLNAPLDQSAALDSQSSSPNPLGASVTTRSANEVVLGLAAVSGNIIGLYPGNSFTSDSALKGNGWAHLITSTAGIYAPQWVGVSRRYLRRKHGFFCGRCFGERRKPLRP